MQKIEGVELKDLVQQASEELLKKQQADGVNRIKKLFAAIYDLGAEIRWLEAAKRKKQEQLEKKQRVVEELKQGNWSVLSEEEKDFKKSVLDEVPNNEKKDLQILKDVIKEAVNE